MACLVAPAAAAIIASVTNKKIPAKYHVEWLLLMLGGGTLMLIVDHIASGEVVPYFPFFTRSWSAIWPEILQIGLPMTITIFAIWIAMVWISIGVGSYRSRLRTKQSLRIR